MELLSADDLLTTLSERPSRVELYWNRTDLDARPSVFWDRARQALASILARAADAGHPYDLTEVEDLQGICLILTRRALPALPAPHGSPE